VTVSTRLVWFSALALSIQQCLDANVDEQRVAEFPCADEEDDA
jgi:hypothetical protein